MFAYLGAQIEQDHASGCQKKCQMSIKPPKGSRNSRNPDTQVYEQLSLFLHSDSSYLQNARPLFKF